MADDGDKTEEPTPKRRQKAIEQGNIPKSRDLTAAALVIGSMMLLNSFGGQLMESLRAVMSRYLSPESMSDLNATHLFTDMVAASISVGMAMAPVLIGIVLLAIIVAGIQTKFSFSMTRLQPNLNALNPTKGISKLFSQGQGLVTMGQNILKLICVGSASYMAIHDRIQQIISIQRLTFVQIFALSAQIVYSVAMRLGFILLALALIDYFWQRYRINKQMKMSKQEVKDEMRSMDGDPGIKRRRKEIQQQLAMKRMKQDIPKANVVVTNPTELAIALQYDPATMNAPRVVAKGQGYVAQHIRELAIANGIPILERKSLARAMYKLVEVGQEIPEQFYSAVAEILAYVFELTGKSKKKVA